MEPSPARIGYVGLRAKTARAIVVTIAAGDGLPDVVTRGEIVLATPASPELFQPYHAVMDLPWDRVATTVGKAESTIAATAAGALKDLVAGLCDAGVAVSGVGVVGAPERDLGAIASPHIRAHALEGRLFRSVVEQGLQVHEIRTEVLLERDAYASVAARLKQSSDDVKRAIQDLGRSAPAKGGPWRAEQKLAALAALFVLR